MPYPVLIISQREIAARIDIEQTIEVVEAAFRNYEHWVEFGREAWLQIEQTLHPDSDSARGFEVTDVEYRLSRA
jgi:hypothetical protein